MKLWIIAIALAISSIAHAQDSLIEKYRDRVVFIQAYKDASKQELVGAGTGVVLRGGYVLTARHLLGNSTATGPERAAIFAIIGSSEGTQYRLNFISENEAHDALILRFLSYDKILDFSCIRPEADELEIGEKIAILGFPKAANMVGNEVDEENPLDLRDGTVSSLSASQLYTGINTTFGHSGSPVFDSEGQLVAFLRGEINNNEQGTDTSILVPVSVVESILPSLANQRSFSYRLGTSSILHDQVISDAPAPGQRGVKISVPAKFFCAQGADVRLFLTFKFENGNGLFAHNLERQYVTDSRHVAAWSQRIKIERNQQSYDEISMAIPYYAFNVAQTGFVFKYRLQADLWLSVNGKEPGPTGKVDSFYIEFFW